MGALRARYHARARLLRACTLAALVLGGGCSSPRHEPPAVSDEPTWRAQLIADRATLDHEMRTEPTSPLAGVERFTPTSTTHLAIVDENVRLDTEAGPATLATLEPRLGGGWSWRPVSPDVSATTLDAGRPVPAGPLSEPTVIRLSARHVVKVHEAAGSFVVTAFDSERPQLHAFTGVPFFDPDPRFVVRATLEPLAVPPRVELATSRGLRKPFLQIGTLRFELAGKRLALAAYRPADSTKRDLFVPFRDATTGRSTYGAARFLDLEAPSSGATVIIDFNRAYNPLCAYSPAYNCPLPPQQNTLSVAVEAGERDPHLH